MSEVARERRERQYRPDLLGKFLAGEELTRDEACTLKLEMNDIKNDPTCDGGMQITAAIVLRSLEVKFPPSDGALA